ncbi:MBL fold metallo-hydrolase [Halobacteriales archaeon QS_1_68_17]|nr:MAG: MBL fold metallo-hydrolase [Halobacteriales archaeon QS_1_68_17]
MAIGDYFEVSTGECTDLYYVDVGLYDTPGYGSVYVLDADRPAVVDTGIGTRYELILETMAAAGIDRDDLAVIAPTHVHLDHAGGAGYLAEACPNAEVVIHEIGAPHLVDPTRLVEGTKRAVGDQWQYYAEPKPVPGERLRAVEDGDVVDLGDHALAVHHAPGHAPHQAIYRDPANDAIFTADAAGIYVPETDEVLPTTPPSNFDLEASLDDIETIRELDPSTLLYGHFGAAPTDDRPARYADTLREFVAEVADAKERLGDDEAVAEYFAENYGMEDVWPERKSRAEGALNARGVLGYLRERE